MTEKNFFNEKMYYAMKMCCDALYFREHNFKINFLSCRNYNKILWNIEKLEITSQALKVKLTKTCRYKIIGE